MSGEGRPSSAGSADGGASVSDRWLREASAVTGASSTKKPWTRSYFRSAVEPPSDTYSRAVVALAYRSRARGFPVGLMGTARSTSPSTSIATFRTGGTAAHRQCSGSPSATAGGSPSPSNGSSRSASYVVSPSA